jgi:hypothetical protein
MEDFEIDVAAVTHDRAVVRQTASPITKRSFGPSLSVFVPKYVTIGVFRLQPCAGGRHRHLQVARLQE